MSRLVAALSALYLLHAASAAAQPHSADERQVLIFVGMPGAGKSFAAERIVERIPAPQWSSGDVIRQTTIDRGLERTAENDRLVAQDLAADPGSVGRRLAEMVAATDDPLVLVEGFRTTADLAAFRSAFPNSHLIAIEVGTDRRYARMLSRGRVGEDNIAFLRGRDRAELALGLRNVMRQADFRIRPRGNSTESLDRSLTRVLHRIDPALGRTFRNARR